MAEFRYGAPVPEREWEYVHQLAYQKKNVRLLLVAFPVRRDDDDFAS